MSVEINRKLAAKVLTVVDAGLCSGLGNPRPGEMCVEAADAAAYAAALEAIIAAAQPIPVPMGTDPDAPFPVVYSPEIEAAILLVASFNR